MALQITQLDKFDPVNHRDNVHDAFCEFVQSFQYEYDAIARDPPKEEDNRDAWIERNKRKVFLGRFASRNLQKDYEDVVPEVERAHLAFKDFVDIMKERYEPARNYTLRNFKFHELRQKEEESFDNFVHRVKHEAKACKLTCGKKCTVADILIRDQIIIGTTNEEITKNALKNQWDLKHLIDNGRSIKSAALGAEGINAENNVSRIKQGRYSRKSRNTRRSPEKQAKKGTCRTCSSRTCKGGKRCLAYGRKCFACRKKGHLKGSQSCKYEAQKRR